MADRLKSRAQAVAGATAADSRPRPSLLRSWRSVVFAPVGDGQRRRRGTDGLRLASAVLALVGCLLVIRYDSRVDRAIVQVIHPPPWSITWLVTVVYDLGSFGVTIALVALALIARRWVVARDIALSAAGAAAASGILIAFLGLAPLFLPRLLQSRPRLWEESLAVPADSEIRALLTDVSITKMEVSRSTVKTDLEKVSAGITGCDALIAQTGSVLLTAKSGGGRALSVLPVHHVVVATSSQLLPDLPAAFELLERKYAPNFPSFMTLITGPSRTGDIERVLVLGAHGPRKLTVILVGGEGAEK